MIKARLIDKNKDEFDGCQYDINHFYYLTHNVWRTRSKKQIYKGTRVWEATYADRMNKKKLTHLGLKNKIYEEDGD